MGGNLTKVRKRREKNNQKAREKNRGGLIHGTRKKGGEGGPFSEKTERKEKERATPFRKRKEWGTM